MCSDKPKLIYNRKGTGGSVLRSPGDYVEDVREGGRGPVFVRNFVSD